MAVMWVQLVIFATFVWAVINIVEKVLLEKYKVHMSSFVIVFGIFSLVFSIIAYPLGLFSRGIYFFVSILAGFSLPFATYAFYKALKIEEASRVIPLIFAKPVLVLLIATIFLKEIFPLSKYVGIVLIISGAILISFKHEEGLIKKSKALKFILISVVIWGMLDIVAKWATMSISIWSYFATNLLGSVFGSTLFLLSKDVRKQFFNLTKRPLVLSVMFLISVLLFGTYLVYLKALVLGPVSLVSAMNSVQALFVFIFAIIMSLFLPKIFHEETDLKTLILKLISIFLIIGGVFLIA